MCYSIYLLHLALIAVFFKVTRRAILPQLDFLGNFLVQCVVTMIPVLLCCAVFYLLVERPCMDPDWPAKLWQKVTGRHECGGGVAGYGGDFGVGRPSSARGHEEAVARA